MKINFYKYQGIGNDFIILDNRQSIYNTLDKKQIAYLCNRHFGIGADGLMKLENSDKGDFTMKYYNSDGNESSMCGNGGRCIVAFAKRNNLFEKSCTFHAIDGVHTAEINNDIVKLKMNDVNEIKIFETYTELNTGSPHYVCVSTDINRLDMKKEGRLIRYSPKYKEHGINVNFVEVLDENTLYVRTYERGVEDETLSCGTGVCACAIDFKKNIPGTHWVKIKTPGGELDVHFSINEKMQAHDVFLEGKAQFVFEGVIDID